jgi:elongation factor G
MESSGAGTVIRAEVPMSEILTYGTTLTAITQGRGSFRIEMGHYDLVPQLIAEKILAAAKQPVHDEEEE